MRRARFLAAVFRTARRRLCPRGPTRRPRRGIADLPPLARAGAALSPVAPDRRPDPRSEEHTSELQSLMRISYAVFCLTKKKDQTQTSHEIERDTVLTADTPQHIICLHIPHR